MKKGVQVELNSSDAELIQDLSGVAPEDWAERIKKLALLGLSCQPSISLNKTAEKEPERESTPAASLSGISLDPID